MKSKADYIHEWLWKTGNDLKIARREMGARDSVSDAVCFHFQQAVEKLLKAWLIWEDVDFPFTHNIEVLLDLCEESNPGFADLRGAEILNPYTVEIRYPDDFYSPTRDDMMGAAAVAERVERFVLDRLAAEGLNLRAIDPYSRAQESDAQGKGPNE